MSKNFFFLTGKEYKSLQERKLRYFITNKLYPFSKYYRDIFDKHKIKPSDIKKIDDLRKIPFTSKANFLPDKESPKRHLDFILMPDKDLIKKYLPKKEALKLLAAGIFKGEPFVKDKLTKEFRPIFLTATTGTTYEPVSFLYTTYDMDNLKIYGKRLLDIFNLNTESRAVNIFPYAPHLAFWQTVIAGIASNIFILSTGGGKTLGTEGNINAILKSQAQFLIGVPSYVYHILKIALDKGLDFSFLNTIALGASRVPEGFKRKITSILGEMGAKNVKVLGTYGFTEARCAWGECPTDIDVSSGYHTYPDMEIFEIIDPETGEVKCEGEDGELVYTTIDSRGSCVIRYRTGDLVRGGITGEPCPYCGRAVPRISSDIVRASNVKNIQLSKIKGSLVNLNNLERFLDDREEIDEWQIEIKKKNDDPFDVDELLLYVSTRGDIDKENFLLKLNNECFSVLDVSFNRINIVSKEDILKRVEIETSVKAKKIVDKRPKE